MGNEFIELSNINLCTDDGFYLSKKKEYIRRSKK